VTVQVWTVPDVYLLIEGAGGRVAVPHLTLTFLDSGLALDKTDGEPVWFSSWDQLHEMAPVEPSVLPDGRDVVVILVVQHRGRRGRHRFVLATDDPVPTEAAIRDRAAAHGLRTNSEKPAVSRPLTVSIALSAAAAMAVLLLSAVHLIRF
jgi:hypothetical protein